MKRLIAVAAVFCLFAAMSTSQLVYQPNASPTGTQMWWTGSVVNEQVAWFPYYEAIASGEYSHWISRTTDGGSTWHYDTVHIAPTDHQVGHMSAIDASTAWVVTYDAGGTTSGGMFKTTDGGDTWTQQTSAFPGSGGYLNNVHFFDADNGLCTGDQRDGYFEVYTTSDGGENWVRVPSGQIPAGVPGVQAWANSFTYHGDCFWFADNSNRVYRTTDKGYSWAVSSELPGRAALLAFEDDLNGLISLAGPNTLYRTTDGGATWSLLPTQDWVLDIGCIAPVPGAESTYVSVALGLVGLDTARILVVSTNAGSTWKWIDLLPPEDFHYPRFASRSGGWVPNATGRGAFRWPGYTGKHIWRCAPSYRFLMEAGGVSEAVAVSVGNYGTDPVTVTGLTSSAGRYTLLNPPSTPFVLEPWKAIDISIAFSPGDRGEYTDSLVISSDASNAPSLGVTLSGKGLLFNDVTVGAQMYAVANSLYSVITGTGAASSVGPLDVGQIQGLAVNPLTQTLYGIMTDAGSSKLCRIDPVVVGGLKDVTVLVGDMRAIAFSPHGTLFGGTTSGTLLRIDPATGDTALVGSSAGTAYAAFSFSPSGQLYASVKPALFNRDAIYTVDTTDGSTTLVGKTGDNTHTPCIAFNAAGDLFGLKGTGDQENKVIQIDVGTGAGTEIGPTGVSGLQAITLINTPVSVSDGAFDGIPKEFVLLQNYPNPFNPSTSISFGLPKQSQVMLTVYNMLGQEVVMLVDETMEAGDHKVVFDASAVASGVYFYRLTAGSFVSTKKMVLVR
jgi:hypothetical protein